MSIFFYLVRAIIGITLLCLLSACSRTEFTTQGSSAAFQVQNNNSTDGEGFDGGSSGNQSDGGTFGIQDGENGGYGPTPIDQHGPISVFAQPGVPTSQAYVIPQPNNRKVDILFVVDPSGSMQEEQQFIGQRFANLTATIANLDWRIGITSTDMSVGGNAAGHDGRLIEIAGNPGMYFIDKNTPQAQMLFEQTISLPDSPTDGDDDERGIYNAIRVVEKSAQNGFFRADSYIHMVMVSDEDERSSGDNLELRDLPFSLINTVGSYFPSSGLTAHSIITRPGDFACKDANGKTFGEVYADVTMLTGGYLGDICSPDYSVVLSNIGQTIQYSGVRVLSLPCVPVNGSVSFTGVPTTYFVGVDGNKLVFSQDLPPGAVVNVNFTCAP